jgi:inosine-uridine nucleoside N-ribohydrolase
LHLKNILQGYKKAYFEIYGEAPEKAAKTVAPHDFAALFSLLNEKSCVFLHTRIDVELYSLLFHGSTRIDVRNRVDRERNVILVQNIDVELFWNDLKQTMS